MSEEEYKKLTVRERISIIQAITDVNGFSDFQNPAKA
jgi:hypothetical protein